MAIDILIINAIVVLLGLMLFRKSKGSGWLQSDFLDADETSEGMRTKKVIFEEDESRGNLDIDVDTMEEINGKLSKKLMNGKEVAN